MSIIIVTNTDSLLDLLQNHHYCYQHAKSTTIGMEREKSVNEWFTHTRFRMRHEN